MSHQRHPLSALFAQFDLSGQELDDLAADIKQHGLRLPVVLFDGQVLDGWNRYTACGLSGVKPTFTSYEGDDPWAFVCSVNMQRRSMTPQQKAAVFLLHDEQDGGVQNCTPSVRKVKEQFKVSHGTAQNLVKVAKDATPEVKQAVVSGEVSLDRAAKVAKLPKEEQGAALKQPKQEQKVETDLRDDAMDDFDPIAELETLQKECDELKRRVESLTATDGAKELDRYVTLYNASQVRLNQEMAKIAGMDKELRSMGNLLLNIRKALGVDDDRVIVSTIKKLVAKAA